MADPNQPGGMSVTLKADEPGGKYNDAKSPGAWIVFHGSREAIREQILATFTFEEGVAELDLSALIVEANRLFKAVHNVGSGLGGRVIGNQGGGSGSSAWSEARGEAKSEPAEEKAPPTLAELIEAAESVDALKELWLDKSDDIKAGDLVDAWKAKGVALKEAAG